MSHFAVPVGDELSQIGEKTGQKVDSRVSRGMRTAKDKNGERLFNSNEFLTSRQVASFFSRLASKRSVDVGNDCESQSDDEDQNEAEKEARQRQTLRNEVMTDIPHVLVKSA